MIARISKYKMKPDSIAAAEALLNKLKPQIMGLSGTRNFVNVVDDDGNGYVIAVVESEEIANSHADAVQSIWAQFADFLEGAPEVSQYRVLMSETNA